MSRRVLANTRDDIRNIYWLHASLAGELAYAPGNVRTTRLSFYHVLRVITRPWLQRALVATPTKMEEANWRFHREMNIAAAPPKLLLMLRTMLRFIPRHFYAASEEWVPISEAGHLEINEAFKQRDAEEACEAWSRHVIEAGELMTVHFSDKGYWTRLRSE